VDDVDPCRPDHAHQRARQPRVDDAALVDEQERLRVALQRREQHRVGIGGRGGDDVAREALGREFPDERRQQDLRSAGAQRVDDMEHDRGRGGCSWWVHHVVTEARPGTAAGAASVLVEALHRHGRSPLAAGL
jgi:hypothetical protein